jgi:valyl-tRNA synthetase
LQQRLQDPNFVEKAPKEVVEKNRSRITQLEETLEHVRVAVKEIDDEKKEGRR